MDKEVEVWNGIHGQVVAPKGTFDKIFNEAKEEDELEYLKIELDNTIQGMDIRREAHGMNIRDRAILDLLKRCKSVLDRIEPKEGE